MTQEWRQTLVRAALVLMLAENARPVPAPLFANAASVVVSLLASPEDEIESRSSPAVNPLASARL